MPLQDEVLEAMQDDARRERRFNPYLWVPLCIGLAWMVALSVSVWLGYGSSLGFAIAYTALTALGFIYAVLVIVVQSRRNR